MSVELREPICCVLGHVDAGKTSFLDKLRSSNVASKEAGGITQQIGATYIPMNILQKMFIEKINTSIPGLLVLDTPGHANFSNLRSRGSSICDIAIIMVDLFDGLQPQTKESLMLLRETKTPFIVAVNKIDKIYTWKSSPELSIKDTITNQTTDIKTLLEQHIKSIIAELAIEDFNACLYYNNKDNKRWVNIVPISAKHGDGIPDLMALLIQLSQKLMVRNLAIRSELRCIVMEVTKIEGYGTTLDVILVDGELSVGDTIIVCGMNNAIITTIRILLSEESVDTIVATKCLKIVAKGLDDAVAGTLLYVAKDDKSIQEYSVKVQQELKSIDKYETTPNGVYIKASTLGSLQALYSYLSDANIPVSAMGIGPITRKDLVIAGTIVDRSPRHACVLGFDINFIDHDLQQFASALDVVVYTHDVMYQLVELYNKFVESKIAYLKDHLVHPCEIELKSDWIFRSSNPLVLGCTVKTGKIQTGVPLVDSSGKRIGIVQEIFTNGKKLNEQFAVKGSECSLQIESDLVAGRHILKNNTELCYSELSRVSIDALKEFKKDIPQEDIRLVLKIKKLLNIE